MNISGGKYKGRKIYTPDERVTRPTLSKVREGVFNSLYSLLGEFDGLSFFDVFGGSGIMGIEALSRGFSEVMTVEQNKKTAQILKKNYALFNETPELVIGNAISVLTKLDRKFDVAFVDPPYESGLYEEVINRLLDIAEVIVVEHPTNLELNIEGIKKQKKYGDKFISYIYK